MLRGLLFDVDGTLVTLNVDGERLRTTMAEELNKLGFDISFVQAGIYSQDIMDKAKLQVDLGNVEADFGHVRATLYRALDALELEWNARSEPIAGVTEVLEHLKRKEPAIKLATLTNSGRAPSQLLLKKYDLLKYFDYTFSRDELPFMKPRPEAVTYALKTMGLAQDDALFVGDSVVDIKAARGAGLKVASVVSGRYTAERLRAEGADYVLGSMSELPALIP
ncbi:MAG: HAD family hydrolase [Thaumarchaeota archaeon]|nr:HAD family hydrolase [Nitrososphaerota archaeon]